MFGWLSPVEIYIDPNRRVDEWCTFLNSIVIIWSWSLPWLFLQPIVDLSCRSSSVVYLTVGTLKLERFVRRTGYFILRFTVFVDIERHFQLTLTTLYNVLRSLTVQRYEGPVSFSFILNLLFKCITIVQCFILLKSSYNASNTKTFYRPFSHYGDLAGWQNSPTRTPNWKRG